MSETGAEFQTVFRINDILRRIRILGFVQIRILLFVDGFQDDKVKEENTPLKVAGNEKQWGSGRSQLLGNRLGPWRSRFIYNLNTQLLNKTHISVSAHSSKMSKRLL